ncbi:hypothetical protein AJ87_05595 [Rhizobium yanglingense]|nr:hypothetical protein AJ87_05595 [Rhizobium yanglingense]
MSVILGLDPRIHRLRAGWSGPTMTEKKGAVQGRMLEEISRERSPAMNTYENFTVRTDADGIALVTWDMPGKSMNVFTEEVMDELNAVVDATVADTAVKGVVITSGKSTFSGGADLSMIKSMFTLYQQEKAANPQTAAQKLFDLVGRMTGLFRKLETCGKPWVSAINGTCMGGALEMSLACHGRVASNAKSVKIALPEVKVGIFPGAGGTQRVARLADAQSALQMMTTGQSLSASRAKAMNLVHQVVEPDQLIPAAKQMIKDGLKPVAPWDEKGFKAPGGGIWRLPPHSSGRPLPRSCAARPPGIIRARLPSSNASMKACRCLSIRH